MAGKREILNPVPPVGRLLGPSRLSVRFCRFLDIVLVLTLMILLWPVAVVRAVQAWRRTGRVTDRNMVQGYRNVPVTRYRFAGDGPGSSLPALLTVLGGGLGFVGPEPLLIADAQRETSRGSLRHAVRPGLISLHRLRQRIGVAYETEHEADQEFIRTYSPSRYLSTLAKAVLVSLLSGPLSRQPREAFEVLGVPVANVTMHEALDRILDLARSQRPSQIAFVNPHCLNESVRHPAYRTVLREAALVLADGIGLQLAARMLGNSLRANVNGTDLFPLLCERMSTEGCSLYLLGGKPGVALAAAQAMRTRFPNLRIAGVRDGHFSADEESDVLSEINRSGAEVLLAGMGVPRQDLWLSRQHVALEVPVRIGVGGLFDFYSGRIPRAPRWLREIGLEWTWRLWQEPARMWRRYLVGNPLFLWRVWRQVRNERGAAPPSSEKRVAELIAYFELDPRRRFFQRVAAARKQLAWRGMIGLASAMKRLLDIVGALSVLVLASPLLLLAIALIKLESPGPIFFKQVRIGRWGRPFVFWKLRSMYVDAEACLEELRARNEMAGGVIFKIQKDPRITRIGRILRRTSLDELPQIWNVLKGDMSLVGPRPPLPSEVEHYTLADRRRLDVTPGLTCFWQISGRSSVPFPRQVALDVEYIESQNFLTDIRILVKTVPAVLMGRGAY